MKRLLSRLLTGAFLLAFVALPHQTRAEDEPETEASDLAGKTAPDFSLDLLGGGTFKLSEHRGKEIVVLDFWATWCGPCVYALPIVTEVTAAYKDKGVVFVAMNQAEDAKTIEKFLADSKLAIAVALDRDAKAGRAYDVQGIPTTVIIDKQGKVQVVHVGASPNLKVKLVKQLDDLLAGKSLIPVKELSVTDLTGLEAVWSAPGKFGGLAADGGTVYALNNRGQCTVLNAKGEPVREFPMEGQKGFLRAARFSPNAERGLVSFDPWGADLKAWDAQGKELWSYPGGDGVVDVWPASLKEDGAEQIVVGYSGGIHVLNGQGKPLWKSGNLSGVSRVCSGVLELGAPAAVLAVSKKGVHLLGSDGKRQPDLAADLRPAMVRVVPASNGHPAETIVGGSSEDGEMLIAMNSKGKELWRTAASSGKGHIDSACPAPGQPWLAVSMRGGRVFVVDADSGKIVAESNGEASRAEVAWLEASSGPLLVVTGRDALHAYRLVK